MGRFTKAFFGGVAAAALLAAGSASAADFLLTNFDNGTNESEIGTYFYYYAACSNSPLNQGPCKIDDSQVLLGAEVDGAFWVGGADEYGPFSYKGGPAGVGGSGVCAVLPIKNMPAHSANMDVTNGQPITIPGNSGKGYYPGFGFGILLTDDDDVGLADFSKVTAVKFKIRATGTAAAKVGFKVETIENSWNWSGLPASDPNPSNAFCNVFTVPVGGDWVEKTIAIPADLEQEAGWGKTFEFNKSHATKIAWYVNANAQTGLTGDGTNINIFIDDVYFVGDFTYTSPDICQGCTSTSFVIPTPSKKLADFDGQNPLANTRSEYWYHYTDQVGGGSSEVSGLVDGYEGLEMDVTNKGREGEGNAAALEFTLGAPYLNASNVTVEPFVGIGTNLFHERSDDGFANARPFATGGGGVYFEYKTVSVDWLDVEFADEWDARKNAAGERLADTDGEVYYTRVPGTNGAWMSAQVPFSKLVLPKWVKRGGTRRKVANGDPKPLDINQLAQLKFKRRGAANSGGEIYIDNVYFYGAEDWGEEGDTKVTHFGSKANVSGLRATYSRGVVGVNWSAAKAVASGRVQLVNTKGRVVASAPITATGSRITANLSARALPTGMYFVRMNAKDVNGAKVVQQTALSIVK